MAQKTGVQAAPVLVRVRQVYPAVDNGRVTADLDAQTLPGELHRRARARPHPGWRARAPSSFPPRYIVTRFGVDYVRLERAGGAVIEAPIQRGGARPDGCDA